MVNHIKKFELISNQTKSNDPEPVEGPNQNWFVYICESKARHYYIGISINPHRRLLAHNAGTGSKMAKDQGNFKLVYISEDYLNKSEARKPEIQIKKWTRIKKENLIKGIWK